jgi:hypothetical protein
MFVNSNKEISLSPELLKTFSEADISFLVNKIIGYIHSHTTQLYLLLFIVDNTEFDNVKNTIISIITNYIGYNYGSITEILEKNKNKYNSSTQKLIQEIIVKIDEYYTLRKELPKLKELRVSPDRVKLYMKVHNKQIQKMVSKNKSPDSFLMDNFVHKVQLKAGKTWFCKYNGKYSKPSSLTEVGDSFELPRGEFIDPINQAFLRFSFRAYKRKV